MNMELPANIEVEQALLGACLVNNKALDNAVVSRLREDHFSEALHARIWEAMRAIKKDGRVANPITVKSSLPGDIKIGEMTIAQYLARLAAEAVTIINAPDYAITLMGLASRRATLYAAQELTFAAANNECQIADGIRAAREELTRIVAEIEDRNHKAVSFADMIDGTLDRTEYAATGGARLGLDPGLNEIMALTGPWENGQLIIIGAGVKQGKSALTWQTLFTMAENHVVAGNSGEMPRDQLIRREIARRTGISATRQKRGSLSPIEMDEIVRASAEMKRLKVAEINCQRLTLDRLDERITRLKGEYGLEAYFLDHIGKLEWSGKLDLDEDWKKGQRATSRLKDMAMKHEIPIIAVTHLKKATFGDYPGRSFRDRIYSAMNRRPNYQDLVGNMDKDADQVLIPFNVRPILAGMEPEEGTADHDTWDEAMRKTEGRAELIMSLSRESEFPRRKDIEWHGATTSFGPTFKQKKNSEELFA